MKPLTGPDAQVLHLLHRVVAIGRHRGTFTAADTARVAHDHLPHPHVLERKLLAERRRADTAEAEVQRLRALVAAAEQQTRRWGAMDDTDELPPRKVVEVSRREREIFIEFCEGRQRQHIAAEFGIAPETVSNAVSKVAHVIGADVPRAAALVNRRVVALVPRARERRAAA